VENESKVGTTTTNTDTMNLIRDEIGELIPRGSDFSADIWCIGEITHQLLTRRRALEGQNLLKFVQQPNHIPEERLQKQGISKVGIEFVNCCLKFKPEQRLTVQNALQSAWINSICIQKRPTESLQSKFLENFPAILAKILDREQSSTDSSAPIGPYAHPASSTLNVSLVVHTGNLLAAGIGDLRCFAFSRSGSLLAAGHSDGNITLWDIHSRRIVQKTKVHPPYFKESHIKVISFSHSSNLVAVLLTAYPYKVVLWNLVTNYVTPLDDSVGLYHDCDVVNLVFSPDDRTIAFVGCRSRDESHRLNHWDITSGRLLYKYDNLDLDRKRTSGRRPFNLMPIIRSFPRRDSVVSLGIENCKIGILSLESSMEKGILNGIEPASIKGDEYIYSPDGSFLTVIEYVPHRDERLPICLAWKLDKVMGTSERILVTGFSQHIVTVSLNDEGMLAVILQDGLCCVFNLLSNKRAWIEPMNDNNRLRLHDVKVSSGSRFLAGLTISGAMYVWNLESLKPDAWRTIDV
jgi:WD40 repeat protein